MITKRIGNCFIRLDMTVSSSLRDRLHRLNGARVEVGLFASRNHRLGWVNQGILNTWNSKYQELTNAALGAIHEFGSAKKKIPERSFLRMPLLLKLFPAIKGIDWIGLIQTKGIAHALGVLGLKAEGVIHAAFRTGGWGWWPKLKRRTILAKGHDRILIETGQMEKAIDSRVVIP